MAELDLDEIERKTKNQIFLEFVDVVAMVTELRAHRAALAAFKALVTATMTFSDHKWKRENKGYFEPTKHREGFNLTAMAGEFFERDVQLLREAVKATRARLEDLKR